jgi:UDP-GlcNAc:undecaprenyl-phosphate GlcNAc-1-phosphate transferase
MDGLAGGISLITAAILSFFFWRSGNTGLAIVALALAGSVAGFLVFNFPPASIFMGDSGSLFLGFTLAVLAIARQPQASNVFAVMSVPTLLFLLPILDTTLVMITRILRGQSPVQGGRDHTSHRLIAFGLSEKNAVLVMYAVAIFAGLVAATLESIQYWYSLVLVPVVILSLALLTAYLGGLKVVTSPVSTPSRKSIVRVMLELTFRRRLLEAGLDFLLIGITYYLAFLTRNGFSMSTTSLEQYLQTLPLAVACSYLSFFVFGVYRGVWRYVGVDDLMRYFIASVGAVVLLAASTFLLFPEGEYSPVAFLLYGVFLFFGLAASRSSFRILDKVSSQQSRPEEERVLICGAGDTGEMALRWILMNPTLEYRPIGFLDENPYLTGRQIHGVDVLGNLDQLDSIIAKKQIDGVILTPEIADSDGACQRVVEVCQRRGCWIRTLRLEFEPIE